MIRTMKIDDYKEVRALWESMKGIASRSIDDTKEKIERLRKRKPKTRKEEEEEGK
ncbi:GNAT family N-acetyltransferase, partial [Lachnotalea glycerini]